MKKTAITLVGVIIAVIGLHAFRSYHTTAVTGKLDADPKRSRITARNGHEYIEAGIGPDSTFTINLPKGTWKIELTRWQYKGEAKNILIDTMIIGDKRNIDLGLIAPGL
jgi:hypothetical protein